MANDNKISIDIKINTDGQGQISQYVHAFDDLRKSINNLSQPTSDFSKSVNELDKNLSKYTDSLNKLKEQQQDAGDSGEKVANKLATLSNVFTTMSTILAELGIVVKGWVAGLTGGLSVVIALLPEIIKLATAIFKGKDAINAMVENLKNMNEVMRNANKDAADQTTRLQILYKSATDLNNAYSDRVKSAQELKREFPSYFKNLSDEDISTKKAIANYDELSKSIVENAKAKAALNKITEQAAKILDADFQIEKIKNANFNEVERKKRELAKRPKTGRFAGPSNELELFKSESDERAQVAIEEQEQIKKTTKQTIDFLEKYAGGTSAIAKAISGDNEGPIVKSTKHNKAFYEAALAEQQALLDNMDAGAKGFEKRAASIRNKIASISKIVNAYSQPTPKVTISTNKSRLETEALEAHSINFSQQIELDKQHYDTEQALLQTQLEKKLISQAEFNRQSEALQEQYHLAIGDKIKTFNKTDLDGVKQHMQDMVDANKLQGDIEKDQRDVKKAILPGDKLKAEQQLITDKYNYEIVLAAGNAEKIKQLEEQKQQDLTTLNQQYEQERKEFALQTAQKVSDAAFSLLKGSIQSQADAKIKGLETQKQADLANTNLTAGQRKAIEDKYKKKEAEEKVKAFKAEQRASILQAVINGALAITKATSQTGVLSAFVIPGIIAETAIQVATIAKQKAPQYAKGGIHYQSDGRGALLSGYNRIDDTNAYLRSGEAVVVSEAMRNPWARNLVSAINVAYGGRDFSVSNPGRGYAIGGIYTDGGNANRYYNQPVNDVKDLANTVAYQMINNFPPIYVDVKDVNNQQNILAQTVNRVNL